MTDIPNVPRRMRRFHRDQDTKLMKHLSKQVKQAGGIKEIEKQRIILSLKRQLEGAKGEEVKDLASHLFEQASMGKDETKDLVFTEVMKRQRTGKELSNKEADSIATSIYAQLKERKESQQRYEILEKKQLKKEEKREREQTKIVKSKEKTGNRRKERNEDMLDFNEPEEAAKKDQSGEVEKIKRELSFGLGEETPAKKKSKLNEEKDDLFSELEEFNDEPEKPAKKKKGKEKDDDFNLEGFETEL